MNGRRAQPAKSTTATHALVVGGTGMLRGVSIELARRGMQVSVVARASKRLRGLEREGCWRIFGLPLDWKEPKVLEDALNGAVSACGPFSLAIVWIHSAFPGATHAIARCMEPATRFFHVLSGSGASQPRTQEDRSELVPLVDYREVFLGFVPEHGASRWLTHEEICAGVLRAIDEDSRRSVVGTVEPWSSHP